MTYDIHNADVLAWVAAYDGEPFHALLCDPPYHLTEIVKRFGAANAAPAQYGTDGAYNRMSRGFMGKNWDGGDVAFRPETWAAFGRLLYPGAFGMAFASTRGFHRMACAIEDAGFIIHPMIAWNFASGFPKATRLDTQIDRNAGKAPRVVGQRKHAPKFDAAGHGYREKDNGYNSRERESFDVTEPATDMARAWAGHRYGLQALKPAIEPIIVFQKPYQGRPVESITRTGAGAINVDGGRIGSEDDMDPRDFDDSRRTSPKFTGLYNGGNTGQFRSRIGIAPAGRWPANLVLSHAPACNGVCVEGCPVRALGEQSGERGAGSPVQGTEPSHTGVNVYGTYGRVPFEAHDDSGTAARFFFNADYMYERLEDADALVYVPKASTAEREAGLDGFDPTTVDDGRQKPIDNAYLRGETTRRNIHPTIKPIALARHLATLLLPPDRYAPRRLFVPFAGAASEMIGAILAGWEVVQGVELEADHIPIARARLDYWQQRRWELMNPAQPVKVKGAQPVADGQLSLFDQEAA